MVQGYSREETSGLAARHVHIRRVVVVIIVVVVGGGGGEFIYSRQVNRLVVYFKTAYKERKTKQYLMIVK